ncbi:hypothetical protein BX600DRAFT_483020 [Xylariales sp. PMI_506]|nr:hypothetical protein BX600DRAFT_483020 [Xylariales sp. PMI_506]
MSNQSWSDGPLTLMPTPIFHDMWTAGASHMCNMHNAMFLGYNSIYNQALHVNDASKADFIGYCLAWHKFVISHAENEETSLFLRVEQLLDDNTIFQEAHAEHETFKPGLQQFHDYLSNLSNPRNFSGSSLITIMEGFQENLQIHLRSEITVIARLTEHPNTPAPKSPEEIKASQDFDAKEGRALIASGFHDVVPFFLFNFDRDYEGGLWSKWPPIPKPVRWVIIRIALLLHPGWWKFAACDSDGRRKEAYATPTSHPGNA